MCLIIQKPVGITLATDFLNNVIDHNPHGWGIMWHSKGKLNIRKGMQRDGLFTHLSQLKNKEVMIHARYTTHGETNIQMAHPFHVIDDIFLIHNGVLSGEVYQCSENKVSDTFLFAKEMREVLSMTVNRNEYLRSGSFQDIVERETKGSSIVFADAKGFVEIGDALDCTTTDGLRVSNEYAFTVNNASDRPSYKSNNYEYEKFNGWNDTASPAWWEIDVAIKQLSNASYEEIMLLVKSDPSLVTEMLMELELHYKPEHKLNQLAA